MADGRASKCEQICRTLRRYIGSGHLAAGQQLPAERALSERFATTRITIKEALSSLEADGLIYRAERRGWFVAPPRLTYDPAIHTHFHQWIGEQQRTAETRVLAHGKPACQQRVVPLDGSGTFYAALRNPPPAADRRSPCSTSAITCWRAASRHRQRSSGQLLTELYRQRYGIGQAGRASRSPLGGAGEIARALNLAQGSAVLRWCGSIMTRKGSWWIATSSTGDRTPSASAWIPGTATARHRRAAVQLAE
jgi:DNA-binding transcriptional regulator YhcF (GntR family)